MLAANAVYRIVNVHLRLLQTRTQAVQLYLVAAFAFSHRQLNLFIRGASNGKLRLLLVIGCVILVKAECNRSGKCEDV